MRDKGILKKAYIGESQANRNYTIWASQAEKEGLQEIAELFKRVADEETQHATEIAELQGINKTRRNLKKAVKNETKEFSKLYPEFARKAEKKEVKDRFEELSQDEQRHAGLFKEALDKL